MLNSKGIQNEPARHYADIWAFCLNSRTTRFYSLAEFRLQKLNNSKEVTTPPEICISPYNFFNYPNPFWFVFERRPIFNDINFNLDTESIKNQSLPITNTTILGRIRFFRCAHIKLSYGALTSMNEYYYHPTYDFPKRSEWTVSLKFYFHYVNFHIFRFNFDQKNSKLKD